MAREQVLPTVNKPTTIPWRAIGKWSLRIFVAMVVLVVLVVSIAAAIWWYSLQPRFATETQNLTVPYGFSDIQVESTAGHTPGRIYLANMPVAQRTIRFNAWQNLTELDASTGKLWFVQKMPLMGFNLQRHSDDTISYYRVHVFPFVLRMAGLAEWAPPGWFRGHHVIMNAQYEIQREIYPSDDLFGIDGHELLLLENDHVIMMEYEERPVTYEGHGCAGECLLLGQVIRELDANNNVIFEWHSLDHYALADRPVSPSDAVTPRFMSNVFNVTHANSLAIANDGNLIMSVRYYDEVIKIDRQTGEVMWRIGGKASVNNEFTFIDDPLHGFSHQHHAQILENGNLLLFDNGVLHDEPISRVVEYEIDEINKTARLVWSQYHPTNGITDVVGSVQRLENGNSLVSWGSLQPNVTEVTPEGDTVLALYIVEGHGTYRAYHHSAE